MRCLLMAGAAIAGGSVIAVGPIAPVPDTHVFSTAVRLTAGDATGDDVALILGGGTFLGGSDVTGTVPTSPFVTDVYDRFVDPAQPFVGQPVFPAFSPIGLATPEQDFPLTGPVSLPFNLAVDQSVAELHTALTQTYAGDDIVVLGYSQSTAVATLEMDALDALPADQRPSPADLQFALLGDMNNPDGGVYERFSFINPFVNLTPIAALNQPYFGATPPDTPYPTDIYTVEYDGVADFPQYPIDIPADLNAGLGVLYSHLAYATLTPEQLATAQLLPGSAALTGIGETNYYLIPVEHLPLLEPLYQTGVLDPIADLIAPDLTYIVNLGYGSGPADVPTPIGLFPNIDPTTVIPTLEADTVQGFNNALADLAPQQLNAEFIQLLSLPLSILTGLPNGLADEFASALGSVESGDFSTLLSDLSTFIGLDMAPLNLDVAWFESVLNSLL